MKSFNRMTFLVVLSVLTCSWIASTAKVIQAACTSLGCNNNCTTSLRWGSPNRTPVVCTQYAQNICETNCNSDGAAAGKTCGTIVVVAWDQYTSGTFQCSKDTLSKAVTCATFEGTGAGPYNTVCAGG
jgi:hypothetical protein